jgi:hypothetical protein
VPDTRIDRLAGGGGTVGGDDVGGLVVGGAVVGGGTVVVGGGTVVVGGAVGGGGWCARWKLAEAANAPEARPDVNTISVTAQITIPPLRNPRRFGIAPPG